MEVLRALGLSWAINLYSESGSYIIIPFTRQQKRPCFEAFSSCAEFEPFNDIMYVCVRLETSKKAIVWPIIVIWMFQLETLLWTAMASHWQMFCWSKGAGNDVFLPTWGTKEPENFQSHGLASGQIITTSAEVTLNGGLITELPQNPLNSGLGIILICPDVRMHHCFNLLI